MLVLEPGALIDRHSCADVPVNRLAGTSHRRRSRGKRAARPDKPLRCVWSGYPANDCACCSRVPEDVVADAWRAEIASSGNRADRFFHFVWHSGVWLGYGLKDGRVRGVCCPFHSAERDAHARAVAAQASKPAAALAQAA